MTCADEVFGKCNLDDGYKYLGTRGVALINPNEHPDGFAEGKPMGFLTEPVARDANRKPVSIDWRLKNNAIDISVYGNGHGIQYPVVVDPQWFVGRWLAKRALLRINPETAGVIMTLECSVGAALDWPETVGQPWYRRVWHASLRCLAAAL